MVGNFGFTHTPDILFGIGSREKLSKAISKYGNHIVLLTGKSSFNKNPKGQELVDLLLSAGITIEKFTITQEPSPVDIDGIVEQAKLKQINCIVGIGGGSVIDAGKAVSAMITVTGSVKDYLEGVGKLDHPGTKIPYIAIPTTAGTGSEATKNAVITELGENGFKKSLRHDNFVPNLAIVDPELMRSCPPQVTAAGGMDAFTQLLESYLSINATPFTDALAISGMEKLIPSIEKAVFEGDDLQAREDMAYASLLSGITLANAGLGVVHGFAQPLGSLFPIPHGVVCGTLMAATNQATLDKIIELNIKTSALSKYATLGTFIVKKNGKLKDLADIFIQHLLVLTEKLALPKLSEYKVQDTDFERIIALTGLKNHPVELNTTDLRRILQQRT